MNTKNLLVLAAASLTLAACSRVESGNVGVKAYLLGGQKGVDSEVLGPGRYWIGFNEELYIFPTVLQTATWTNGEEGEPDQRFVFQDKDGLRLLAGVTLTYAVDKAKVPILFQKYRRGIAEITDPYLKNAIRGALVAEASQLPVDLIYGPGKEALMKRVEARVRSQMEPVGIIIERLEWYGDMALPETVLVALNAKIEANQKAAQRDNEVKTAEAQARIDVAKAQGAADASRIRAQGVADANKLVASSLTAELIEWQKVNKWKGDVPQITGGGAQPIVDLR